MILENPKLFKQFAKNLFLISKVHVERKKAKEAVDSHHEKMRSSIIRMRLSYTDVDRLKEKVDKLIEWERRYAKLFKADDKESQDLKDRVRFLENELKKESQEKQRIISEDQTKIKQLSDSLENIKNQLKHLHLEKAKRQHRLKALEQKIKEKIDVRKFYNS